MDIHRCPLVATKGQLQYFPYKRAWCGLNCEMTYGEEIRQVVANVQVVDHSPRHYPAQMEAIVLERIRSGIASRSRP